MAQRPDKKNRLVSAVVLAELQWTNTDVPYLSLGTCPGECGSVAKHASFTCYAKLAAESSNQDLQLS